MRLGYPCLNRTLEADRPNRGTTVKHVKTLTDAERREKLDRLLINNLENNLEILRFNVENDIEFYRFCSDIVPLATHPVTEDWDYLQVGTELLEKIGDYIKQHDLRITMHPEHFTVLNSTKNGVVEKAIEDLKYHSRLYRAMGLDTRHKIVLHLGGVYGDKEKSKRRFIEHFRQLEDEDIKERLIVENDDDSYRATEVLEVARELEIPMVMDVHHFNCNHTSGESLAELLPLCFATWKEERPIVHFSSPGDEDNPSLHAADIDADDFREFMTLAGETTGLDFDVMLECKNKELALFKLRRQLGS